MKRHFIIAMALAAFAFAACQREEIPELDNNDEGLEIVPGEDGLISIKAGFEDSLTKSHVSGNSKILWSTGDDAIYVFGNAYRDTFSMSEPFHNTGREQDQT